MTAKAYRTVSNDALCIIAGIIPIHIKIKETAELYKIVRGKRHKNLQIDHDKLPKQWLHPADRSIATDSDNIQVPNSNIYTDGRKSEQGVGAGIVITGRGTPTVNRMDARCTNNQAEAFAILKALDYVQINNENEEDKVATVHTDGRITLDSLNNANTHS